MNEKRVFERPSAHTRLLFQNLFCITLHFRNHNLQTSVSNSKSKILHYSTRLTLCQIFLWCSKSWQWNMQTICTKKLSLFCLQVVLSLALVIWIPTLLNMDHLDPLLLTASFAVKPFPIVYPGPTFLIMFAFRSVSHQTLHTM